VPENALDETLERLLAYPPQTDAPDAEPDRFVVGVMDRVRRERRRRRAVLVAFGLVGALFGLIGAGQLAGPIGRLFTESLTPGLLMQATLLLAAGAAFHAWLMGDDLPLRD
jgi:hypothetical protein